jgi:RNA-directed DNA polymerase
MVASGRTAAQRAKKRGERLKTYQFLGFTCYWGLSRSGKFWRLKYTSRADRFRASLKKLRKYLRGSLNGDTEKILQRVIRVLKGWINYHGISDNGRRVSSFICLVERTLFWWINRRGGQKGMNWKDFAALLVKANFPRTWKVISMFAKR